jgi:hypothetical protein
MITGSGNKFVTTVYLDSSNTSAQVWWCEGKSEWHWCLIWEDGGPYGTHMHNGTAPTKEKARADIVKTMMFVEETWPRIEYFKGA